MVRDIQVGNTYYARNGAPVKILYIAPKDAGDTFEGAMQFPVLGVTTRGQPVYFERNGQSPEQGFDWGKEWDLTENEPEPEAA